MNARNTVVVSTCFLSTLVLPIGALAVGPVAEDRSVPAGIYEVTPSWSANVHDYNSDGWRDILLVRHGTHPARLYKNVKRAFIEESIGTFTRRDRHDCAWGDVNADGYADVYCTIGGNTGIGTKTNELWIQQHNRTFVNQAEEYGVTDPYGRGRYTTFINANGDRFPDLFVGNAARVDGLSHNRLFINSSGIQFSSAPEYGTDNRTGGRCVQAVDFDNDGWQDLLVCGGSSSPFKIALYHNERGRFFTDVAAAMEVAGFFHEGYVVDAMLLDLDLDKRLDLVQMTRARLVVQLRRNSTFGSPTLVMPLQAGAAIEGGDIDRNKLLDLYVVQGRSGVPPINHPDLMLLNKGSGTFESISIPQTRIGGGQEVVAIDYDRNGTSDFIVLNGDGTKGPIQLISFP